MFHKDFVKEMETVELYHKSLVGTDFNYKLNYEEISYMKLEWFQVAIRALCLLPVLPNKMSFLGWVKSEYSEVKRREEQKEVANEEENIRRKDPLAHRYLKLIVRSADFLKSHTVPSHREFWGPIEKRWGDAKTKTELGRIISEAEDKFQKLVDNAVTKTEEVQA